MRPSHPGLRSTGPLALAVALSLGCADLIGIDDWGAGGSATVAASSAGSGGGAGPTSASTGGGSPTASASSGGPICGNGAVDGDDACDDGNDVDDDGCTNACEIQCEAPDGGWDVFKGADSHCYGIQKVGQTWNAAVGVCNSTFHGDLAAVTGDAEQAWLALKLQALVSRQRAWIGANDLAKRGTWVWTTGEPFVTTQWGMGQPNDFEMNEDCGIMDNTEGWAWNDLACADTAQYALCERHPGLR